MSGGRKARSPWACEHVDQPIGAHGKCKRCYMRDRYSQHKERLKQKQRSYTAANAEKLSLLRRQKRFGITPEQQLEMAERQRWKCACCGDPITLQTMNMDHNHQTGQLRELLCNRCNPGIGWFNDSVERLAKAIEYLKRHEH